MTDHLHKRGIKEGETVVESVLKAIASVTETPIEDLGAIYESVDPESLNRVFETTDNVERDTGKITFPYEGLQVTVLAVGEVIIGE